MPREPSLDDKSNVPRQAVFSFKINIGTCRYKGTLVFFPEAIHPLDVFEGHEHVSPPPLLPLGGASNVCFDFVQRVVDLCESLFDAQRRQPGRRVLVPALLHEFGHGG